VRATVTDPTDCRAASSANCGETALANSGDTNACTARADASGSPGEKHGAPAVPVGDVTGL
jgi:hypothetical protein